MPVSKKRKKPVRRASRPRRMAPEIACPVWEYRAVAEARHGEDDLTAADLLSALISLPYRMWDAEGSRIDLVYPQDVAARAGVSLDDWLTSMEQLADEGFMSWDEENCAHYLSVPTAGD